MLRDIDHSRRGWEEGGGGQQGAASFWLDATGLGAPGLQERVCTEVSVRLQHERLLRDPAVLPDAIGQRLGREGPPAQARSASTPVAASTATRAAAGEAKSAAAPDAGPSPAADPRAGARAAPALRCAAPRAGRRGPALRRPWGRPVSPPGPPCPAPPAGPHLQRGEVRLCRRGGGAEAQ